jgi:hypothetical protein
MSSSADAADAAGSAVSSPAVNKPHGWDTFTERTAPATMEPLAPHQAVAVVVQRFRNDLDEARDQTRDDVSAVRKVAAQLARQAWRLDRLLQEAEEPLREAGQVNLYKRFDVVRKEIRDRLSELGIEADDPTGRPFDDVEDVVQVLRWRHDPSFDAEEVTETYEPIVRDGPVVLHPGQVVVGAPPVAVEKPAAPVAPSADTGDENITEKEEKQGETP